MATSGNRQETAAYPAYIREVAPAALTALSTPLKSSGEYELVDALLERAVAREGSRAALECGDVTVSYRELWRKATSVSAVLAAEGAGPSDVVAVHGAMSPAMCISAVGVLLARGVLVFVDRSLPVMRKRRMVEIANARFVIDLEDSEADGEWIPDSTQRLECPGDHPTVDCVGARHSRPRGEDAAYVFFTSGSTGSPKGVLGTHGGLAHFIAWQGSEFRVVPTDRVAQVTSPLFDVVLREILLPLTRGACLVFPTVDLRRVPGKAVSWLGTNAITIVHAVPSVLRLWVRSNRSNATARSLRLLFSAGESLSGVLCRELRDAFSNASLVNLYGPTETTLAKTWFRVPETPGVGVQPVGVPLPECQVFFFDERDGRLSRGGEGEIWLRTPHRTRGYLAGGGEAFVRNPLGKDHDDVLYRTGDMGNLDEEGRIVVRGRVDDQVKVNGVRIETTEIEGAIEDHPRIRTATVVPVQAGSQTILIAFFVRADAEAGEADLKSHVGLRLPGYMVPSGFVEVGAIPLLPSGKVDRHSLIARWKGTSVRKVDLGDMVSIWSEAFGHPVDPEEDFFEMGGDSVVAASILAGVYRASRREVSFEDFLENSSCERLVAVVNRGASDGDRHAVPCEGRRSVYGSMMTEQQRTLFETVLVRGPTSATNVTRFLDLLAGTREADVRRALSFLTVRFVALRQYFTGPIGSARMEVSTHATIPLRRLRLSTLKEADLSSCEELIEFTTRSMDIFKAPLARAIFVEADDHAPVMGLAVHHVVVDGISMGVLMRTLSSVIGAIPEQEEHLLPMDPKYAPQSASSEQRARSREYWSRIFSEPYDVLKLGFDGGGEGHGLLARIESTPERLLEDVERCRRSKRISVFSIFFAAYCMSLARRIGRSDIVVNVFGEGLERAVERDAVGCFYRPLPIRLKSCHDRDGVRCARESYKALVDAQRHQAFSYADIMKHVAHVDRTGSDRFPLTSLAANQAEDVEGIFRFWAHSGRVRSAPVNSVYDLMFYVGGKGGRQFAVCARRDAFGGTDIRELCNSVTNGVASIVRDG